MRAVKWFPVSVLLFLAVACSKEEDMPTRSVPNTFRIQGSWALYETGSSIGAGFNIRQIPTSPVQGLSFDAKGRLTKSTQYGNELNGFFNSPFYRVDSTQAGLQLRLLNNQKGDPGYSAGLRIQGDDMTITPFCYEGCYFRFTRIYRID